MQILLLLMLAHYPLLLNFMKLTLFSFLFSFVPVFHSNKSSGAHTDYGKSHPTDDQGPENRVYQSHSFKKFA